MAGVFIVIESWLLMQSGPAMRGAALSLYLAVFYAALSGGQFLLNLSDPAGIAPFGITAAFLALSTIPIALHKKAPPKNETEPVRLTFKQLVKLSPLGFLGGIISGMLLAAVYGLLPLYAKGLGMNISEIGAFMAVLIFGGFTLQWPFGRLADKGYRRTVLNIACFATAVMAIALALAPPIMWLIFTLAGIFGAFSFTLYPLSMAYACEKVKENEIVAVTGGFVLSYGIGAIVGPILAPLAMSLFGSAGLFYFLALITIVQGSVGLKKPAASIIEE